MHGLYRPPHRYGSRTRAWTSRRIGSYFHCPSQPRKSDNGHWWPINANTNPTFCAGWLCRHFWHSFCPLNRLEIIGVPVYDSLGPILEQTPFLMYLSARDSCLGLMAMRSVAGGGYVPALRSFECRIKGENMEDCLYMLRCRWSKCPETASMSVLERLWGLFGGLLEIWLHVSHYLFKFSNFSRNPNFSDVQPSTFPRFQFQLWPPSSGFVCYYAPSLAFTPFPDCNGHHCQDLYGHTCSTGNTQAHAASLNLI